ncbi:hypothetical protein GH714_011385 [Hevea brasiliensis]|uniref:BTB domain-containing protein n=1 Tax=Hevea brasiliensis TaxID=3981 RepID=A0A6A6N0G3_HEVBR|nr:hypothetical protein GH714_011385 [Hevea brasiliensis]
MKAVILRTRGVLKRSTLVRAFMVAEDKLAYKQRSRIGVLSYGLLMEDYGEIKDGFAFAYRTLGSEEFSRILYDSVELILIPQRGICSIVADRGEGLSLLLRRTVEFDESMSDFKADFDKESCSRSINETVNGSHQFTIKGYSLAKGMVLGSAYRVIFSRWEVTIGRFTSIRMEKPRGQFHVCFGVYSPRERGNGCQGFVRVDVGGSEWEWEAQRAYLVIQPSSWGYKRFFRRTTLENSDYIKDDCLVMNCTVGVVSTRLEGPKQYSIPVPPSDMGQGLRELLESEVGCDIVFQVGDETFKAHKLILAARSPVFRAQFFGLVGDPNLDKVVVKDMDPSIFKAMLLFIYTDKLPDVHEITGTTSMCTSTNMVQHLLAAADLYNLDRLKLLCESKLCEELMLIQWQQHLHWLSSISVCNSSGNAVRRFSTLGRELPFTVV